MATAVAMATAPSAPAFAPPPSGFLCRGRLGNQKLPGCSAVTTGAGQVGVASAPTSRSVEGEDRDIAPLVWPVGGSGRKMVLQGIVFSQHLVTSLKKF